MLPARNRMRRSADFTRTVRHGVRGGARCVVVHLTRPSTQAGEVRGPHEREPVLVGFVVPRAVGNAVTRNTVKRRLRHLMTERLDGIEPATHVVVRALPAAARASSRELEGDLVTALSTARRRAGTRGR